MKRNTIQIKRVPIALITGASRGIGAAVALKLAQDGYTIALNHFGLKKEAQAALTLVKTLSPKSSLFNGDISKLQDVRRMFAALQKRYGRLDVLVNNAGIGKQLAFHDITIAEWKKTFAVNVEGVFMCSQEAVNLMKKNRKKTAVPLGKIITIASTSSFRHSSIGAHYAASKAAILGFSRTLAYDLASEGILVNVVAPGPTATSLLSNAQLKKATMDIPLERAGKTTDVASAVAFLASSEADYITGETIVVSGGLVMR